MALRITTAHKDEISSSLRFEARYFIHRHILTETFDKLGYKTVIEVVEKMFTGSTPSHMDERTSPDDAFFAKSAGVKRYDVDTTALCYITNDQHKGRRSKWVFPGDIVVSNTGKYLGFASVVPSSVSECTTNQNVSTLRLKDDCGYTPQFIAAYLNSNFGQREIESLLTRTGQNYLNSTNFKILRIPSVPAEMIKHITDVLMEAEEKGVKAIELIDKARGIFYSRVGLDFKSIEKQMYFSTDINSFAETDLWTPAYSYPLYVNTNAALKERWSVIPLGEVIKLTKGDEVGSENYIGYLDRRESNVSFIRTSDIVNYETDQYPDFYIPEETYQDIAQDIKAGDILFSKDGKIGQVGMVTVADRAIIASGFCALRLNKKAVEYGLTPEYLFTVLSIREIGIYESKRRTVVASTIPHLREDRVKEMEIPILDKETIDEITSLVREAFKLKAERKRLIADVRKTIDSYFDI